MRKYLSVLAGILAALLLLTSCGGRKADYTDDGTASLDFTDGTASQAVPERHSGLYGRYTYPDKPVEDLRKHLRSDSEQRGLSLEIGDLAEAGDEWQKRMEFTVHFPDHPDNACIVSFVIAQDGDFNYYSTDGGENPSFTIAFQDPDQSQDMITVLTSVMRYLSPGLSVQEAERLAMEQDDTITIDGCSTPRDIGGYQVQAFYTNPYDFFTTADFASSYGVSVKALMQIWKGEVDLNQCKWMLDPADFEVLEHPELFLEDPSQSEYASPRAVYADFTITDCWDYEEWVHGTPTTFVLARAPHGDEYVLCLDPMRSPYTFGVGETYTLVISCHQRSARITYAIQYKQGD